MKLKCVVSACNEVKLYTDFIPIFIDTWKRVVPEITVKVFLIMNSIPSDLTKYKNDIILFKPIPGVDTAFTSQYIRILCPSIIDVEEGGILISDIDMAPLSYDYFVTSIKRFDNEHFICYRNVLREDKQVPICYNVATREVWRKVNKMKTEQDVINRLTEVYNSFDYEHGGWFKDQFDLYSMTVDYDKFVILTDDSLKFKRLDRENEIDKEFSYTDYHMERPFNQNVQEVINSILSEKEKSYLVPVVIGLFAMLIIILYLSVRKRR